LNFNIDLNAHPAGRSMPGSQTFSDALGIPPRIGSGGALLARQSPMLMSSKRQKTREVLRSVAPADSGYTRLQNRLPKAPNAP
jgi:hypothetical protein